jgi:isochorismate hydrolase
MPLKSSYSVNKLKRFDFFEPFFNAIKAKDRLEKSRRSNLFISDFKNYFLLMYSSIALAAVLPAPIARITVAAPVTASPPA